MDMSGGKSGGGGKPARGGKQPRPTTIRVHGHKVSLREPTDDPAVDPTLNIDGVDVMVMREALGGVSAPMLNMHAIYPTVEELARRLVEISPVFLR